MTENSFQAGRKVMASANYLRGVITTAEQRVRKWTRLEDYHRRELRQEQADGAKKALENAMARLDIARKKFSEIKFPENNL